MITAERGASGTATLCDGPRSAALPELFAALTHDLLQVTTVTGALELVVGAARRVVPAADLVSVTLRGPGTAFSTPVATDAVATELDREQFAAGHGPSVDAARAGGPHQVGSDDLRAEERWPRFAAAAHARGIGAVLATGLVQAGHDRPAGALTLYAGRPPGLTGVDRDRALLLVTHCSLALARCLSAELATGLRRALDSRDVIGQAKGIIMGRQGVTPEEAFELLRRASQERNVKVADLARTFVARHHELDR